MKPAARILSRALAAFKAGGEKSWTQGALARDKNGDHVGPRSKRACSFCAGGMLQRVSQFGSPAHIAATDALGFGSGTLRGYGVVGRNDYPRRTFPQVLRWFERAIKHAEAT